MFPELIERCNRFLDCMYYPGQLTHGSPQHRDLIKSFFAGAFESLTVGGPLERAWDIEPHYRELTAVDWYPDERFRVP